MSLRAVTGWKTVMQQNCINCIIIIIYLLLLLFVVVIINYAGVYTVHFELIDNPHIGQYCNPTQSAVVLEAWAEEVSQNWMDSMGLKSSKSAYKRSIRAKMSGCRGHGQPDP